MRYVTTPIYYVNDVAHLGHAYTSIIADVMARFYRLKGEGCYFLTGTDEHGQKIEEAARLKGKDVRTYCDEISASFKQLWDDFDLSYDRFIRTVDEDHIRCVQAVFLKMFKSGDIYKGVYEGPYCVSCESFFTPAQLVNDACPDCGKQVKTLKEESYFFKLSKYEDKLLKWLDTKPILPENRANEVRNFIKSGLKDLSITRSSFEWGIKLPSELNDHKHVIYVWLDALLNYISALGYGGENSKMSELWPATMHIVGKDILRFHAVYWPAFLMSLDLPLPTYVAAHGWWVVNGEKMSKSKGNAIAPKTLSDRYGIDAFRYFLLREIQFGRDGDFNEASLRSRINSELCNELGNLLNRVLGMAKKYSDLSIKSDGIKEFYLGELCEVNALVEKSLKAIEKMALNKYLENIFEALSLANVAISKYEPWVLIKNEPKKAHALVALCANILVKAGILLSPVLIKRSGLIAKAFGINFDENSFKKYIYDNDLGDFEAKPVEILYEHVEAVNEDVKALNCDAKSTGTAKPCVSKEAANEEATINIKDFAKVRIQIADVLVCEKVPKSDKLLRFELSLGDKTIQVISGIAAFYDPKDLVGKQVCVVTNLKKAKIFGHLSEGMILSAKDTNGLCVISTDHKKQAGSLVC